MTAQDLSGIVRGIAPVLREYVSAALVGFAERLSAIEQRQIQVKDGKDGKDADLTQLVETRSEFVAMRHEWAAFKAWQEERLGTLVSEAVSKATPAVMELVAEPAAAPDVDAIAERVKAEVTKALRVPNDGRDGTSVTVADVVPLIVAEVQKEVQQSVAALPPAKNGKDGASVDLEAVDSMIVARVTKAFAAIPMPLNGKDGTSVTPADVQPLIVEEVERQVKALPVPKDGVGVLGLLIDRDGHLIATLSDGATKDVGAVVGRDVDRADVERFLTEELAKWPRPKDGKDGLGFDDMEPVYDEHGRLSLKFIRGDNVKTARVPGQVYQGVYKPGETYEKGDGVTWGGSYWIAQEQTQAKPGESSQESRAWRLSVKKGADGKQGIPGEKGTDGRPGRDGVDRRYA